MIYLKYLGNDAHLSFFYGTPEILRDKNDNVCVIPIKDYFHLKLAAEKGIYYIIILNFKIIY